MNCNKINRTRLKATLSIVALSISSAFLTACNSTNSTDDRSFARSTDERRMGSNDRNGMRSGMEVRSKRIEAAVENGDMTREEANKMLAQMRKRMAEGRKRGEGHDAARKRGEGKCPDCKRGEGKCPDCKSIEGHDRGESRTINWDGINARKSRIEAAVESGDMTREEADERYKALKNRMNKDSKRGERGNIDWDGIKARIEAAVENGDMTREEADKKLNALEGRKGKNRGEKSKEHRKGHDTDKNSSDD